ncbi:MAG TPA: HAMP domain-containing sensor histidine kinase [Phototrophicaceae bacterium]|nr:HAMP domain-containing sensor histidine kinase [Phototrophicaceae bacterium]
MVLSPGNGHVPNIISLLTETPPAWLPQLSQQLHQLSLEATMVYSFDDAWTLLETRQLDVLITSGDCDAGLKFFSAVCQQVEPEQRPLLVAVGNLTTPNPADLPADVLILPPSLDFFAHQLRSFLSLRTANHQMQAANNALHQENTRLQTHIESQRNLTDEVNLLKNAIVRNVSHELKTPLLQVKSAVAMLAEDVGRDNKLIEYATGATARLEAAVRNITLLNELLNESMEVQALVPVQVSESIQYAQRNLRRSWEHKGHMDRIQVHIPRDLPPVLADKQGLSIILQLLLDNALKFSQEEIEVSAAVHNNFVTITVRDYGIGIAPDKIEKIFDSFYQIDNSTTRRYGGMGIGLAIVRFILERYQTKVQVKSEEGKGSLFTFALPVAILP